MASPANLLPHNSWSVTKNDNLLIQRLNLECRFSSCFSGVVTDKTFPTSGSRLTQCALYKAALQADQMGLEVIEENIQHINNDIVVDKCCPRHADIFERHPFAIGSRREDHWSLVSYMVRRGHCPCWPRRSCKVTARKRLVHIAAAQGHNWFLRYLTDKGASVNCSTSPMNYTPLFLSVTRKHRSMTQLLLDDGADVNAKTFSGKTPLMAAIALGDLKTVEALLSSNSCDVNDMSRRGITALKVAGCCNNLECAKILLQRGASPNTEGIHGQSPIFDAVHNNNLEMLDLLLKYKAKVNVHSRRNRTPLHYTLEKENLAMARRLLESGADCNIKCNGLPLLMTYAHNIDILQLLVEHGADINLQDDKGYSAFHVAALCGYREAMDLLLQSGALHDLSSSDGKTPLSLACQVGREDVVENLLALGCDVNKQDKGGNTALHYAAFQGNELIVLDLMNAGANVDVRNIVEATPLWNSVYMNHPHVVREFLLADASVECVSTGMQPSEVDIECLYPEPRSLLWVAIDQSSGEMVRCLLEAGVPLYRESWITSGDFPMSLKIPNCLRELLVKMASKPPSLLEQCRTSMRRYLKDNTDSSIKLTVDKLMLPKVLKSFVNLEDV